MTLRAKQAGGGALGIAVVYIIVVPFFWPLPDVSAVIPTEAGLQDVMKMNVAVHAWHPNVDITRVRFYVDYTNTTAKGTEGIFYPQHIIERTGKTFGGFMGRTPISMPYTQRLAAEIDLGKFADEGLLGPGELIGKLDISFNYATSRPGKSFRRDPTRSATRSVPFRIDIHG